jgi:hypothetical protein
VGRRKALRAITPKTALPPEHKALEAIKELQQADRIYLHKTAFAPPPIKEDKRMTGDMAGAASYGRASSRRRRRRRAGQLRELVGALSGDGPLPALWTRTAHDWVRERIADDEQRLAAQRAIQDVADGCLAAVRCCAPGCAAACQAPVLLQAAPGRDAVYALRGRWRNDWLSIAALIGIGSARCLRLCAGAGSTRCWRWWRAWRWPAGVGSFTVPGDAGARWR